MELMEFSDEELELIYKSNNVVDEITRQIAQEQAKQYDDFIQDKLTAFGYDIDTLKDHKRERIIHPKGPYEEDHYFFIDGICALAINKKIDFDLDNPYMHKSRMELRVIGGMKLE